MPRALDPDARRTRVVDAVWRVAARDGLDAVTARSVATEAELSLGSVTRAYPRQEDLHVEAMRRLAERVGTRLADPPPATDPLDRARHLLTQVLPLDDETHAEALVYYSYLARARTVPALRRVADDVDDALLRLCDQVAEALAPGLPGADRSAHAAALHAFTEGLAFGLVTWPHRRTRDGARRALGDWLAGLARLAAATP